MQYESHFNPKAVLKIYQANEEQKLRLMDRPLKGTTTLIMQYKI